MLCHVCDRVLAAVDLHGSPLAMRSGRHAGATAIGVKRPWAPGERWLGPALKPSTVTLPMYRRRSAPLWRSPGFGEKRVPGVDLAALLSSSRHRPAVLSDWRRLGRVLLVQSPPRSADASGSAVEQSCRHGLARGISQSGCERVVAVHAVGPEPAVSSSLAWSGLKKTRSATTALTVSSGRSTISCAPSSLCSTGTIA